LVKGKLGAVTAADRTLFLRVLSLCLVAAFAAAPAWAQITQEEGLAAVYPGATVRTEQVFLTPSQRKQVLMGGGTDVLPTPIARYVAMKDGKVIGRAYVDTHAVGTGQESLLISLDATGQVLRIDVTAFQEPLRPIAGARLTARETTSAVRRVLAIDAVLQLETR
jgi:hypothetical protein